MKKKHVEVLERGAKSMGYRDFAHLVEDLADHWLAKEAVSGRFFPGLKVKYDTVINGPAKP